MAGRLYRRGGVWYCWGYDAHGRRWRESTHQVDRKAAEIVSREVARRRAFASTEAAPVVLHGALVSVGAADKRAGRSAASEEILRQKGRQLVAFFGPDFDLARTTKADLERYVDRRAQDVSRHTIAKELGLLRRAIRVAGLPWADATMPDLGTYYVPRERWLTFGEYERLRAALNWDRPDFLAAFCYLGVRDAELYRISSADVDTTQWRVRIRGTKTERSDRWIPIAAPLRDVIQRRASSDPLFPRWVNVNRDLRAGCARAKIAGVTPNDLRRTFCSWLANAGVPLLVTSRLMGHTSTRMVERVYARLGVDIQVDAVSRLPGVYAGEPENTGGADTADTVDGEKGSESP